MIRKVLLGLAFLIAVAAALFFTIGPIVLEQKLNTRADVELPQISPEARALHARLAIADMHADTLLWRRSLLSRATRGHVDLPRLEAGNVALQVFSSVTQSPPGINYDSNSAEDDTIIWVAIAQLQPIRTWTSLVERSLFHADRLTRFEAESEGRLRIVRTRADIDRLLADRLRGEAVTGALLSVEGLHNLDGDAGNLDRLFNAGFRMASPTHFFDNRLGGSMHGEEKGGLTDFGRAIVRAMEQRRMIVDIAHASPAMVDDILAMATRPVVSSHGGVQAVCDVNRNLTDDQITMIATTGGVIGIGYWDGAICSADPQDVVASILHVRGLVGIEHVGLGSDFDGSTTVPFDTSELAVVTQLLMDAGLSEGEIAAVMGGNVIRLLRNNLPRG
ncbi:dipeptidase [Parasphingopyxis marina]|uniref:Dipeptidase n=1 Tax=Parasphingopyxis marina TaxID=2761622 RepID=A0A842I1G9_9SPHN|nr:dipeptidase [Parasphingopyxis marina]MBC2778519.1 dipeptidase [Parasphingopyxis marina]